MTKSDYGFRYPGGHSIVDYGQTKSNRDDCVTASDRKNAGSARSRANYKARCLEIKKNRDNGPTFDKLSPGSRIQHIALGSGTVVNVDELRATIRFDNGNTQTIKRQKINKNARLLAPTKDSSSDAAKGSASPAKAYSPLPECKSDLGRKVISRVTRTAGRLIGCMATDSRNVAFIITDISDGWLSMVNLRTDVVKQFRYPESLIDGTVRVGPYVDVGLQRERQEAAADIVKSLRKKSKST